MKIKELGKVKDVYDGDEYTTGPSRGVKLFIVGVLTLLIVSVAVFMSLGLGQPQHQAYESNLTNFHSTQRVAVVLGTMKESKEVATILAALGGYHTEAYSDCDLLNTSLVLGQRYEAFVVGQDAGPSGGIDCLLFITSVQPTKRIVCVIKSHQGDFLNRCEANGYIVVAYDRVNVVGVADGPPIVNAVGQAMMRLP